jgi:soluble lytic murein transglycosylase-like protein
MSVRRGVATTLAALAFSVSAVALAPAAQAAPAALSPWDAQLYSAAFDAARKGDNATVEAKLALVKDRCLVGLVEFEKLFHAQTYKASYEELNAWLTQYGDLPVAPKIRALAKKRRPAMAVYAPAGAAVVPPAQATPTPSTGADPYAATPPASAGDVSAPVPPGYNGGHVWTSVQTAAPATFADASTDDSDSVDPKAARQLLNAGDMLGAMRLADVIGDRWTGGLAAYRLKRYDEAFTRFQQVALDVSEDPWVRSGGGYWAARSAIAKGSPELAPELLRVAAQFPRTFYGQIAERQLGMDPGTRGAVSYAALSPYPASPIVRTSAGVDVDAPAMQKFIQSEPRAKRAMALAEIGQKVDAGLEIRSGLGSAANDEARRNWTTLALAVNAMLANGRALEDADPQDYPMPELAPVGGYTIDRALVYALIRQETRFNAKAVSYAGAYGLMQLMPQSASWLEHDPRWRERPALLFEPSVNIRIGQDYVYYLMTQGPINGDLLRTVAAYDGGPAPVFQTVQQLGPDADDLLMIESIPVPQARDYVAHVMSNYWIYRRLMGQDTKSLDMLASGARTVPAAIDQPNLGYTPGTYATPTIVTPPSTGATPLTR